jgi:hypothetical protein
MHRWLCYRHSLMSLEMLKLRYISQFEISINALIIKFLCFFATIYIA